MRANVLSARSLFGAWRFTRLHLAASLVLVAALLCSALYWWHLLDNQVHLRDQTLDQLAQHTQQLTDAVAGQSEALVHLVDFSVRHLGDDYGKGNLPAFETTVETVLNAFPSGAVL